LASEKASSKQSYSQNGRLNQVRSNRRAAIIEGLCAERIATEIIRFFGYPRSIVYDVIAKYTALEQSNEGSSTPARKSHSKKRTARTPAVIEKTQALISDDPGQLL